MKVKPAAKAAAEDRKPAARSKATPAATEPATKASPAPAKTRKATLPKAKQTQKPRSRERVASEPGCERATAADVAAEKAIVAEYEESSPPRSAGEKLVTMDRRRRAKTVDVERRKLQPREKVVRRRQIDPTTCERDYSNDEIEFMNALDQYKRSSGRMFPTCSEILEVIKDLGYVKAPPVSMNHGPKIPPETHGNFEIEHVDVSETVGFPLWDTVDSPVGAHYFR